MKDDGVARALITIREASRSEGHNPDVSNNLDTLIMFALRHAERGPSGADEIREAIEVVRRWREELAARTRGVMK